MDHDAYTTIGKGNGRIETRTRTTVSDPASLAMLADYAEWDNLQTVTRVHHRQRGPDLTGEDRYYLSDLPSNTPHHAAQALDATRSH